MKEVALKRTWLGKGLLTMLVVVTGMLVFVTPYIAHGQVPGGVQVGVSAVQAVTQAVTGGESGPDNSSGGFWAQATNGVMALVLSPVVVLSWAIFKIGSFLLGLAGVVFNWVMVIVVFKFAEYLGNSPGMLTAWGILRDFGNIALIFGFVYIGIRTILDIGHFNTGKSLASLVVAAVLMNFSLFAAEAVIDTANVLSTVLYEQSYDPGQCNTGTWLGCAVNHGIAGQILSNLTISSVFGAGDVDGGVIQEGLAYWSDPIPRILKFIGLALLVTIAAMVLFAGAFMLISRGVILAFLMVTSPIGLAGMAVPPLKKLSDEWWDKLIKQAFFAPVFLLLLLVSLKMTDGLDALARSQGGIAAALSGGDTVANTGPLILFALVIGFMIASLMLANKFGIYASSLAVNSASALVFGTTARAMNLAAGGAAYGVRRFQQKTGFGGKAGEVAVNRLARPLERTNLDVRRGPGVGALLGMAGVKEGAKPADHATFKDLQHIYDRAKKGEEGKELEEKYKNEVAISKLENEAHHGTLSPESQQVLSSLSTAELEELHDLESPPIAQNLSSNQFDSLMDSKKLSDLKKADLRKNRYGMLRDQVSRGDDTGMRKWSNKDLQHFITSSEYGSLSAPDKEKFADLLSSDQFDEVMRDQKVVDGTKEKMRQDRYKKLQNEVNANDQSAVRKWTTKDLEHFVLSQEYQDLSRSTNPASQERLAEFHALLSDDQHEALKKSTKLSNSQQQLVQDRRKARFDPNVMVRDLRRGAATGATVRRLERTLHGLNSNKRAQLDDDVLADPEVYTRLDPVDFDAIRRNDKLTPAERTALGAHINSKIASDPVFVAYWNRLNTNKKNEMRNFYNMP